MSRPQQQKTAWTWRCALTVAFRFAHILYQQHLNDSAQLQGTSEHMCNAVLCMITHFEEAIYAEFPTLHFQP
ncbi:hypothetical protein WJX77_002542 [Trebouxia sp. C0004]